MIYDLLFIIREWRSGGVFASLRSLDDSPFAEETFVFTPLLLYSFTPSLLKKHLSSLLYSQPSTLNPQLSYSKQLHHLLRSML